MKIRLSRTIVLLLWIITSTGCTTSPEARVVRLESQKDHLFWQVSVNSTHARIVSEMNLFRVLKGLNLHHGDILLFGSFPIKEIGRSSMTLDWLSGVCDSNRVAVYVYTASKNGDIFSAPVYHWDAPFENPRTLAHASFYLEGHYLGSHSDGYFKMLRSIEKSKFRRMFILGSSYNTDSGFGANEAPYEDEEALLENIGKENGIQFLLLHRMLGF